MEDNSDDVAAVTSLEDLLYWFPWTMHQFPTYLPASAITVHPIFGAHHSSIYYLPVIAELEDELEPELPPNIERMVLIEELFDESEADGCGIPPPEDQHYTVEEPKDEEEHQEKADDDTERKPSESATQGAICDVVLKTDRGEKLDFTK